MARPQLLSCLLAALLAPAAGHAQQVTEPRTGPVIEAFGPVFPVPGMDFAPPADYAYKAVFDVGTAPESVAEVNRSIVTLARFLNMHAQQGVPVEKMQLALVLHGTAGKDALSNEAYRARYQMDNPNLPLLRELADAGVKIYLCGQTAMSRGLPARDLAEPVQLALSAMTALVYLQDQGYRLIAF